jgi:hypothetical protein
MRVQKGFVSEGATRGKREGWVTLGKSGELATNLGEGELGYEELYHLR